MNPIKKSTLLAILSIFTLVLLTGCASESKTKTVTGVVFTKDMEESQIINYKDVEGGKTVDKEKTTPEKYTVSVMYNSILQDFENKELYERVKLGDEIKVTLKQSFNKRGKVVEESITLP